MHAKPFLVATLLALSAHAGALAAAPDNAAAAPVGGTVQKALHPADASLRSGMEALRNALAARLSAPDGKTMPEADYVVLADMIDREIGAISAGRDFHTPHGRHLQWLLGDVQDGATIMRTAPRAPGKRLGLMRVVETLNLYGRTYDHPGWQTVSY